MVFWIKFVCLTNMGFVCLSLCWIQHGSMWVILFFHLCTRMYIFPHNKHTLCLSNVVWSITVILVESPLSNYFCCYFYLASKIVNKLGFTFIAFRTKIWTVEFNLTGEFFCFVFLCSVYHHLINGTSNEKSDYRWTQSWWSEAHKFQIKNFPECISAWVWAKKTVLSSSVSSLISCIKFKGLTFLCL